MAQYRVKLQSFLITTMKLWFRKREIRFHRKGVTSPSGALLPCFLSCQGPLWTSDQSFIFIRSMSPFLTGPATTSVSLFKTLT